MLGYCGQTREETLSQRLVDHGIGECTVRGELFARMRDPWFYDNGAYRDWKSGKPFQSMRFIRDMRRIRIDREFGDRKRKAPCGRKLEKFCGSPDFVIAPDLVAAGDASLAFSREWLRDMEGLPSYLAVQDGMTATSVRDWLAEVENEDGFTFVGIFVGGSLEWKLETGAAWVEFAHASDRRCHIGRVGVPDRVRWAHRVGADSIDSSFPLMHAQHMDAFLAAFAECGGSKRV